MDITTAAAAHFLSQSQNIRIDAALRDILHSKTYKLLLDEETGLYWQGCGVFLDDYFKEKGLPFPEL